MESFSTSVFSTAFKKTGTSALRRTGSAGSKAVFSGSAQAAARASLKETAAKFIKETAEKTLRESGQEITEQSLKQATENAIKTAGTRFGKEAAAEAGEEIAKKEAKEAAESLAKKEIKEIEGGLFKKISDNKVMAGIFVSAAAFGAYSLAKFMEKNMFEMKIVKITRKDNTVNSIISSLGITEDKSDVLVIEVEPVDPEKEMIELVKGAEILIKTISTTPTLANMKLKISDTYNNPNKFEVKIDNVPDYEKLLINDPNDGICTYITNVGLEAGAIVKEGTKDAIDGAKDLADGGNELLAGLLGIDPDMMKLIIILIVLVVAYVYLRPIISLFMPNTKPATGGNNTGGCDCAF